MATNKPVRGTTQPIVPFPFAGAGALLCARQTLGTTSQVCSLAVPSWAKGVAIYPNSTGLVYAIDEDPVTITAVGYTASVTPATAYGIGGHAVQTLWTTIYFCDGVNGSTQPTTLRMRPDSNSSTVDVVFFG